MTGIPTSIADSIFRSTLKDLIRGGRISHLKGLLASLLDMKLMIHVEKAGGTYVNRAHTGRDLVGLVFAPKALFPQVP
ncbi:MAG TPA: hypothetical protein GX721_08685 [Firmicutes bacterium]|nr:hypothetical protein [Bacillota bacterium]